MKIIIAGWIGLFLFSFATVQAAPDPLDSIILESKQVLPNLTGAPAGTPAFVLKVSITNKDSLAFLTLSLRESTVAGAAYALVNRTPGGQLTFASAVTPLTG